ncbi:DUF2871 domain-containing protein [Streptomyces sp. CB01881]|uniref:DUF2871 domain-containing protein n=1 Tax=Streptomyces sp. CB01881 TaxID=2078691 RepID=UPI000CDBC23B|nr:DUF2871 domain-containing protein [Streptomyces sp. CB01881]AUY50936.1 hypothetical protein C2142_20565 [Streptomyces sp. CB01881]TYC74320.1 DUF2871 domain-containing protein [Streptomyces sp. CB01881]
MRKAYNAAHVYMILGVVSGLYYRELTKANDFHGETQLGVVHTHLLALGMLVFLIVLALDKQFGLSGERLFTHFFRFYNAGLAITVAAMLFRGTQTVLGHDVPEAVSLIAGLGHIVLTVGLVQLFILLGKRLKASEAADSEKA